MKQTKDKQKLTTFEQGETYTVKGVVEVLKSFDRLEPNNYFPSGEFIRRSIYEYGLVNLMVFVCPRMEAKYLDTSFPERFMPAEEQKTGLLFPRLPKIQGIVRSLWEIEVPAKTIFVIGDNGFELYKGPSIGIYLDREKLNERRRMYLANLKTQLGKLFPQLLEVESLGLMNTEPYEGELEIPNSLLQTEMDFQSRSFEKYYSNRQPTSEGLRQLAETMVRSYASEGFIAEMADSILLATEGDDTLESWVRRIEMFRMGGAEFPVIFPYIRKENRSSSS